MTKELILFALFCQILLLSSSVRAQGAVSLTRSAFTSSITAQGSLPCQFPFKYKNIEYSACTAVDDANEKPWCSTKTDNSNAHIQGNWRHCTANDIPKAPPITGSADCKTYPEDEPGDCISIHECAAYESLLQQASGNDRAANILRNAVCFNDGANVRICCPRAKTNPATQQQRPTATRVTQPNRRVDNVECGVSSYFKRIVKGEDAPFLAWPWMVVFRGKQKRSGSESCIDLNAANCPGWANRGECQRNSGFMNVNCRRSCNICSSGTTGSETGSSNWFCAGSLIKAQYVLSAAHCFVNTEIEFARIGEFDLSQNPDRGHGLTAPPPQDITIETPIIHPRYRSSCQRCNDIAITKLARPANLDPVFVRPICLPTHPKRDIGYSVPEFQSKLGYATGWGVTDAADVLGTRGSDILQQVNLTIQERSYCHEQKRNYPDGRMVLCAGQGDGRDVCRADSGGPLMIADQFLLKWYVVGITSYGAAVCGDHDAQGIFTSVHHYMDWINRNTL